MKVEYNIKLIEDYMLDNKLSKKEFCKLCGIGEPKKHTKLYAFLFALIIYLFNAYYVKQA